MKNILLSMLCENLGKSAVDNQKKPIRLLCMEKRIISIPFSDDC